MTRPGDKVGFMADTTNPETFEQIVEWAYSTLPQKIRALPDFPGIQVVDEPPPDVLADISRKRKWRRGTELLGLYSGTFRTKRSYNQVDSAPDLIFVFRGPILRCLKGDLRAEVKRVVWHEVAHWLGHDEEEVKELGLSSVEDLEPPSRERETPVTVLPQRLRDTPELTEEAKEQQPRCVKCYSADVTCRELEKPATYSGARLFDPILVPAKICTCNSCGYEWDDEDDT